LKLVISKVIEINNKTRSNINIKLVKKIAKEFLKIYNKQNYQVSIAFVGDARIKKLNKEYCKINQATDVLAFPGEDDTSAPRQRSGQARSEQDFLGEIIIDYAQIKRQAKEYSKNVKEELIFILMHGLLHLVGYTDRDEKSKQEMLALGVSLIRKIKKQKYD
jgi:probable rRNA maturation factor